jgi:hypothetical protein
MPRSGDKKGKHLMESVKIGHEVSLPNIYKFLDYYYAETETLFTSSVE